MGAWRPATRMPLNEPDYGFFPGDPQTFVEMSAAVMTSMKRATARFEEAEAREQRRFHTAP